MPTGDSPTYLIGDTPTNLITNKMATRLFVIKFAQHGDSPGLLIGDTPALISGGTPTVLIKYQGGRPAFLNGDTPTNLITDEMATRLFVVNFFKNGDSPNLLNHY